MSAPKKRGMPRERRMRHDRHYVDMVTQTMGEGIGRMLSIDSISSNQDQPRASLGELDDLIASISKHGILEPLLVRLKEGDDDDGSGIGYELVSGERRFHAALEAGLREVPCIELSVEDDVALEIALIENLQRKDLSPFEEAEGFRTLIQKYSYTHDQVAQAIGKSRVTITEALKILEVPAEIRDLCRHADITAKGVLLEIAKAPSIDAMRQLVQEIVEDRLDRGALRLRRQEMLEESLDDGAQESAASGPDADASTERARGARPGARPFVVKLRDSDRRLTVSLSFRTEKEPEPQEVIAALESMIEQLRSEMSSDSRPKGRPVNGAGSTKNGGVRGSKKNDRSTKHSDDIQAGTDPGTNTPGEGGKEEGAGASATR